MEIRGVENNEKSNYLIVWFVLKEYPDQVFGIKHFPNAKFKKDYLVLEPDENYFEQAEILKVLENNIAGIKESIGNEMENYPQFRLKLLFSRNALL